jgi:hypothetical protein
MAMHQVLKVGKWRAFGTARRDGSRRCEQLVSHLITSTPNLVEIRNHSAQLEGRASQGGFWRER